MAGRLLIRACKPFVYVKCCLYCFWLWRMICLSKGERCPLKGENATCEELPIAFPCQIAADSAILASLQPQVNIDVVAMGVHPLCAEQFINLLGRIVPPARRMGTTFQAQLPVLPSAKFLNMCMVKPLYSGVSRGVQASALVMPALVHWSHTVVTRQTSKHLPDPDTRVPVCAIHLIMTMD